MSTTKPPPAATITATATPSRPTTTTATRRPTQQQQQLPQLSPYPFHLYPSLNLRPRAHPSLNPNPNPTNTITTSTTPHSNLPPQQLYPVATSGRGLFHRSIRPPDLLPLPYRPPPSPHIDPGLAHLHQLPHRSHPYHYPLQSRPRHHPLAGVQVKVASSPSPVSNSNGFKNSRERSSEDNVVTVRGRKVRIVDEASLYTLLRSWLRNGQTEERKPESADSFKSLPRPLPLAAVEGDLPSTMEGEEVGEDEKDEESVDHVSPEDLLKRHVMRAKKVRARLREERLRRIARYKTRLALLLPPQVDQFRNDSAAE